MNKSLLIQIVSSKITLKVVYTNIDANLVISNIINQNDLKNDI